MWLNIATETSEIYEFNMVMLKTDQKLANHRFLIFLKKFKKNIDKNGTMTESGVIMYL